MERLYGRNNMGVMESTGASRAFQGWLVIAGLEGSPFKFNLFFFFLLNFVYCSMIDNIYIACFRFVDNYEDIYTFFK